MAKIRKELLIKQGNKYYTPVFGFNTLGQAKKMANKFKKAASTTRVFKIKGKWVLGAVLDEAV